MEYYYNYYLIIVTIVADIEGAVVKGTQEMFIRLSDVRLQLNFAAILRYKI
jgi:hypothetical protein